MPKKQQSNNPASSSELPSLGEDHMMRNPLALLDSSSSPEEMFRMIQQLSGYQIELETLQAEVKRSNDGLIESHENLKKSLERYTELYDFAPTGYLTLERDGTIIQVNLTAAKMLGVERSLLQGNCFQNFINPEDIPVFKAVLEDVVSMKGPASVDVKLLHDGVHHSRGQDDPVVQAVRIDAVLSGDGLEYRLILSDITEQQETENELNRLTRALLATNHCNQALIHCSNEQELLQKICSIMVETGGYRMAWIGYAGNDKEKSIYAAAQAGFEQGYIDTTGLTWADVKLGQGPIGKVIRSGKPSCIRDILNDPEFEPWRYRAKERGYASLQSFPLNNGRRVFGAITVYSALPDAFNAMETNLLNALAENLGYGITMLRSRKNQAEAEKALHCTLNELLAAKEKAEEGDRLKTAFLANISHEIRTPMNGILGFSQLLKEPQLSGEEQTEYIDLIHQSGERMLNLINDLIDISRIYSNEATVQVTETNVNQVLDNLLAFFKLEARKKGLRLSSMKGLSDLECIIETDSAKLSQILINLIQNAIKFTAKGGIDFGYSKKEGTLEFFCIDSGMGIAVDKKTKIFERFHQVNTSLTRAHEGAGLGLSISKAFVEMLGGSMKVESVEGAGSTFSFTLPYKQPDSAPDTSLPVVKNAIDSPPSLCILVAEDDSVSTILFKKNLKGDNITILCAENGWEAVELVGHHPEINLVLMDIQMPVMNGYDATKLIKQKRPDLPIIAQSAFTSKEEREKATEAGCDGFITKPINKSELLELMMELLKV